jgi:hypothetical protein
MGGFDFSLGNIFPLWINPDSIFFDVNLEDSSKIDLTTDRNDVVVNEKLDNIKTNIEKVIIGNVEKLFSQRHLITDKNRFMEAFFKSFSEYFINLSDVFLENMKMSIIFECSINGELEYLAYNALKDRWKYYYRVSEEKNFRNNTYEMMRDTIEKAYPEDLIIFFVFAERLPDLLLGFSGEHIIVTNKELCFSFDKYLLLPSLEKRYKEKYGLTFEGDYKDCFGTLTTSSFRIEPNITHPFIRLINKNMDKFKGEDKQEHMFLIDKLLKMKELNNYLKHLKEIQSIQKHLLDFYTEKGLLTKEEVEMFVLTEKDFCPYDMDKDFLKQ